MTADTARAPDLRGLTVEQVCAQLGETTDDARIAAIIAELDRREKLAKARAARRLEQAEWRSDMEADYLRASEATNGHMLNALGRSIEGFTEATMWTRGQPEADKYASEELREWWAVHPRLTITAWRKGQRPPEPERVHYCVNCGWDFRHWQLRPICGAPRACAKRRMARDGQTAAQAENEAYQVEAEKTGLREAWAAGDVAWFEYHCLEDDSSQDAETWHHSHQQVTVLRRGDDENDPRPLAERLEDGVPNVYHVQFADGYVAEAFEDELLIGPEWYERPDPPGR